MKRNLEFTENDLWGAVERGDLEFINSVVPEYFNYNITDNCDDSIPCVAASKGHIKIVKWWIERAPHITLSEYREIRNIAMEYNQVEIAEYVMNKIDEELFDAPALIYASGQPSLTVFKRVFNASNYKLADVIDATNHAVLSDRVEILDFLINVQKHHTLNNSNELLSTAIDVKAWDSAQLLLDSGAPVTDYTLVMTCLKNGEYQLAHRLTRYSSNNLAVTVNLLDITTLLGEQHFHTHRILPTLQPEFCKQYVEVHAQYSNCILYNQYLTDNAPYVDAAILKATSYYIGKRDAFIAKNSAEHLELYCCTMECPNEVITLIANIMVDRAIGIEGISRVCWPTKEEADAIPLKCSDQAKHWAALCIKNKVPAPTIGQ